MASPCDHAQRLRLEARSAIQVQVPSTRFLLAAVSRLPCPPTPRCSADLISSILPLVQVLTTVQVHDATRNAFICSTPLLEECDDVISALMYRLKHRLDWRPFLQVISTSTSSDAWLNLNCALWCAVLELNDEQLAVDAGSVTAVSHSVLRVETSPFALLNATTSTLHWRNASPALQFKLIDAINACGVRPALPDLSNAHASLPLRLEVITDAWGARLRSTETSTEYLSPPLIAALPPGLSPTATAFIVAAVTAAVQVGSSVSMAQRLKAYETFKMAMEGVTGGEPQVKAGPFLEAVLHLQFKSHTSAPISSYPPLFAKLSPPARTRFAVTASPLTALLTGEATLPHTAVEVEYLLQQLGPHLAQAEAGTVALGGTLAHAFKYMDDATRAAVAADLKAAILPLADGTPFDELQLLYRHGWGAVQVPLTTWMSVMKRMTSPPHAAPLADAAVMPPLDLNAIAAAARVVAHARALGVKSSNYAPAATHAAAASGVTWTVKRLLSDASEAAERGELQLVDAAVQRVIVLNAQLLSAALEECSFRIVWSALLQQPVGVFNRAEDMDLSAALTRLDTSSSRCLSLLRDAVLSLPRPSIRHTLIMRLFVLGCAPPAACYAVEAEVVQLVLTAANDALLSGTRPVGMGWWVGSAPQDCVFTLESVAGMLAILRDASSDSASRVSMWLTMLQPTHAMDDRSAAAATGSAWFTSVLTPRVRLSKRNYSSVDPRSLSLRAWALYHLLHYWRCTAVLASMSHVYDGELPLDIPAIHTPLQSVNIHPLQALQAVRAELSAATSAALQEAPDDFISPALVHALDAAAATMPSSTCLGVLDLPPAISHCVTALLLQIVDESAAVLQQAMEDDPELPFPMAVTVMSEIAFQVVTCTLPGPSSAHEALVGVHPFMQRHSCLLLPTPDDVASIVDGMIQIVTRALDASSGKSMRSRFMPCLQAFISTFSRILLNWWSAAPHLRTSCGTARTAVARWVQRHWLGDVDVHTWSFIATNGATTLQLLTTGSNMPLGCLTSATAAWGVLLAGTGSEIPPLAVAPVAAAFLCLHGHIRRASQLIAVDAGDQSSLSTYLEGCATRLNVLPTSRQREIVQSCVLAALATICGAVGEGKQSSSGVPEPAEEQGLTWRWEDDTGAETLAKEAPRDVTVMEVQQPPPSAASSETAASLLADDDSSAPPSPRESEETWGAQTEQQQAMLVDAASSGADGDEIEPAMAPEAPTINTVVEAHAASVQGTSPFTVDTHATPEIAVAIMQEPQVHAATAQGGSPARPAREAAASPAASPAAFVSWDGVGADIELPSLDD